MKYKRAITVILAALIALGMFPAIPGACVTLDMHGHVFNRSNGWCDASSYSGEMIRVESGSSRRRFSPW